MKGNFFGRLGTRKNLMNFEIERSHTGDLCEVLHAGVFLGMFLKLSIIITFRKIHGLNALGSEILKNDLSLVSMSSFF